MNRWIPIFFAAAFTCCESGSKPELRKPPAADPQAYTVPKLISIKRLRLAQPIRFEPGAIEATDVILLQIELTEPPRMMGMGGAPGPLTFFNRVYPLGVSVSRDFKRWAMLVPDPGAELASSMLWSSEPPRSKSPSVTPEWTEARIAELARGERAPLLRLGDGVKTAVPVEIVNERIADLDAVRRLVPPRESDR
jgi:hypothetical protein